MFSASTLAVELRNVFLTNAIVGTNRFGSNDPEYVMSLQFYEMQPFALYVLGTRKIGGFGLKEITKSFIKISIASILIGFIALGTLAYSILIYFMRIPEVDRSIEAMKRKV